MKFLDAEDPISAEAFLAALAQEQAQAFAYYVGGDFALSPWLIEHVTQVRQAGYPGMGIYVSTVAGRGGFLDGQEAAYLQKQYGPDLRCCWDLEPDIFRADPGAALRYGLAWAMAVRMAGLSPVLYSTPDGCALIGDKEFDEVWAAVPGQYDPAHVFAISFMPGHLAVQYGSGTYAGVEYDLSISEFDFPPLALVVPPVTPGPALDVMPAEIAFPAVLVQPA